MSGGGGCGCAGGPLVYLPITFAGETRMLPPHPGDDRVFDAYHAHLTQVRAWPSSHRGKHNVLTIRVTT